VVASTLERFCSHSVILIPPLRRSSIHGHIRSRTCHGSICASFSYYKPPTLSLRPTSRIRGLNLKVPSPHPRGREFLRPLGKKTQPTATPSTGGKKAIYGRNAQKYQKCSVGKCPSGARRNRKHRWLKSQLYRFKCLVACRSLKPRGTARNGPKRPCFACF